MEVAQLCGQQDRLHQPSRFIWLHKVHKAFWEMNTIWKKEKKAIIYCTNLKTTINKNLQDLDNIAKLISPAWEVSA